MNSIGKYSASILLLAAATTVAAESLQYTIDGVADPLKANVLAHIEKVQMGRQARLAEQDFPDVVADAVRRAREALRPFGFYAPSVDGRIERRDEETLRLILTIDAGPPIRVAEAHIEILGAGQDIPELLRWRRNWPLPAGVVLDQAVWEEQKVQAIGYAEARGFLAAEFSEHVLELDLDQNLATLRLTLDTGPQYVFGDIDYGEHILKPPVLVSIPRFQKGVPYSSRMLDRLRVDLWKTGYFDNVEIEEVLQSGESPPEVDLSLKLETTLKNSYQGSLGVGTDTGMRVQAQWSRVPMSSNGDRLDLGFGWQRQDDEFSLHTNYRLPRSTRQRQFWTVELFGRLENLDLEFKRLPEDEDFIKIANGDVNEFHVRFGRLKVHNLKNGDQQYFGTVFAQYLNSQQRYVPLNPIPTLQNEHANLLESTDNAFSFGYDADLVDVWGKGFDTQGRRDRAWLFVSDRTLGSEVDFTQVYIGTQRVYRRGERWKLLVRGEAGYTDARVDNLTINVDGAAVDLSITELPIFYRFKAGGSQSVRGYSFESLSNNDIGSNHLITASVEAEYRIWEKWSVAAFFDIGNAFNDWSEPNLRKGVGIGFRWYSIAGPIRIDFAKALDVDDQPWRFHFTIGTPLL